MSKKSHTRSKSLFSRSEEGCVIRTDCIYNTHTDSIRISTRFSKSPRHTRQDFSKTLYSHSEEGCVLHIGYFISPNTGHATIRTRFQTQYKWKGGAKANPSCAVYLGVVVGEEVLAKTFGGFKRMQQGNPGFDYICGKGYKIDAKTACVGKCHPNTWQFNIKKNTIADYFLLLAFDNREDLNPEHIWLIPGDVINNHMGVTISRSTIDKWKQYEMIDKLDKVIKCCNSMR